MKKLFTLHKEVPEDIKLFVLIGLLIMTAALLEKHNIFSFTTLVLMASSCVVAFEVYFFISKNTFKNWNKAKWLIVIVTLVLIICN